MSDSVLQTPVERSTDGSTWSTVATQSGKTNTTASHVVPALGANTSPAVAVGDSTWMNVGDIIGENGAGWTLCGRYLVVSKPDNQHVVLQYINDPTNVPENTHTGETVASGTQLFAASFSDTATPSPTLYYRATTNTANGETIPHVIRSVGMSPAPGTAIWAYPTDPTKINNVFSPYADVPTCIASDSQGNIYAAGSRTGDFGGNRNPFLAKFSPAGTVIWAQLYDTSLADSWFQDIAIDADDNVILTGNYSGHVNFGPTDQFDNPIQPGVPTHTSNGSENIFVVKFSKTQYDPSKNSGPTWLWSKSFGSADGTFYPGPKSGYGIAVWKKGILADQSIVVVGSFIGTMAVDGTHTLTNPSTTYTDIFLIKYDKNGNVLTAKSFGGSDGSGNHLDDAALGVAVHTDGVVTMTGNFSLTINFGGSDLTSTYPFKDIFVVSFNPSGLTHKWSISFSGDKNDSGTRVSIDSQGRPVVAGYISLPAPGGTQEDIVLKLLTQSSGAVVWEKQYGGTSRDLAYGLGLDPADNIYLCGGFVTSLDFGGGHIVNSAGGFDIFVAKLDINGVASWANSYGTGTSNETGYGVCSTPDGNCAFVGLFQPNMAVGTFTVISKGGNDWVIAKLNG